ncbi:DUF2254 family protein [Streptomyces sp. NPDC000133]|uniref:DUF2254 family protein n=1 Tax=Streptomyces sp. NPDC000133 TaxID=3364535 RepID=UPI00369FA66D
MRVARPGPVTSDDQHGHAVEVVHRDRRDEVGGPLGAQSVRALSPAVNDPTTTVQALDRIEDGLLRLAGRPLGPTLLLDNAGHPGSRPPASMGGHRLPHRRNLPAQGRAPAARAAAQRPVGRPLAAVPADRRASVVVRQEALERLSAAALSDPLLRRVASGSAPQGPGGPNARGTGEERPS